MRRMLDPKTIGGGGETSALYRHFVVMSSSKSDIEFNYYTTTDTRLQTFDDLIQLLKRSSIQCSGYFNNASNKLIARYLEMDSETDKTIKVYSNNISDMTPSIIFINPNYGYTITDTSTPVN